MWSLSLMFLPTAFFPMRTPFPTQVPQPTMVVVFASYYAAKKPFILPTQCNCVVLPFSKIITGPVTFLLSHLAAELNCCPRSVYGHVMEWYTLLRRQQSLGQSRNPPPVATVRRHVNPSHTPVSTFLL
jgi:hypothetical protein